MDVISYIEYVQGGKISVALQCIQEETSKDVILQTVTKYVECDWPKEVKEYLRGCNRRIGAVY